MMQGISLRSFRRATPTMTVREKHNSNIYAYILDTIPNLANCALWNVCRRVWRLFIGVFARSSRVVNVVFHATF